MKNENTHADYGLEIQQVLASFMISDSESFSLSQNIVKAEYFDSRLRPAIKFIIEYAEKYKVLPTAQLIKASTNVTIEHISDIAKNHSKWFLETIESFCKYKSIEAVILDGMDLLDKGQGAEVEKRIKDAMTISLMRDLGVSYFDDPVARLERVRDHSNYISTGWKALDKKLYGGFTKGALNVFCGGSGSGKSLFLQNLGLNWAYEGKNVVYFSLELSEDLVAMRIDAMTSGFQSKDLLKRINEVAIAVRTKGRTSGDYRIKKMPDAGTTANDLRAYLKEYEIQTGKRPDVIIVDYLDLMHPNNQKIDVSNLFTKDKYVAEEMRSIASELDCILVTASQLNRCLTLDTLVTTMRGEIEFGNVVIGDYVLSPSGMIKVVAVTPPEIQDVYEIRTKNGKTIKCSARHVFPTNNGLASIVSGLKPGDFLQTNPN